MIEIPQVFHFAWFGGEMPPEYKGYVGSWLRHHPSWKILFWDDNVLPEMKPEHRKLFDEAQHPAYKAEIVRLEAVYRFGGVWIDTDFECFRPIDGLLDGIGAFSAWQYDDRTRSGAIACGIFGATEEHPFMRELVDRIPEKWKPDRMSLGPWYFTPIALKHGIFVFEKKLFYPYNSNEKHRKGEHFPEAFAAHHWAGTWVKHHQETLAKEKEEKSGKGNS